MINIILKLGHENKIIIQMRYLKITKRKKLSLTMFMNNN